MPTDQKIARQNLQTEQLQNKDQFQPVHTKIKYDQFTVFRSQRSGLISQKKFDGIGQNKI